MPVKEFSKGIRIAFIILGLASLALAICMFIFLEFGVYFAVWMVIFGIIFNGMGGAFWAIGASGAYRYAYGGYAGGMGFFVLFILLFGIWIPGFLFWFAVFMFAFSLIFNGIMMIVMSTGDRMTGSKGVKTFITIMGIIILALGVIVLFFPVANVILMYFMTAFNLIFIAIVTLIWGIKGYMKVADVPPEAKPKSVPICSNCGSRITGGQKFCPECGAQIVR